MTDIHVPEHLRILGSECTRLHVLIEQSLDAAAPAMCPLAGPFPKVAQRVALTLERQVRDATRIFNGPLATLAGSPEGDTNAAYRVGSRLEQVLEDMLDVFRAVRDMDVADLDVYPRILLMDAVRELIEQIGEVLERLGEMVDDPEAFAAAGDADATATASLHMRIDCPPALEELAEVLRNREPSSDDDGGAFWRKAGLFALGAWLGASLFDDRCD